LIGLFGRDEAARVVAAVEERPESRESHDLIAFAEKVYPRYIAERMHRLIARDLEAIRAGIIHRLMIVTPPQHGKSLEVGQIFPAFWFGTRPNEPVILASYGGDLAVRNSRQVRTIIESAEYQETFPGIGTDRASRDVKNWRLAPPHLGSLRAVGVGGGLTGHPGMLGIVDDPIKDSREAQSQLVRDRLWEWWRTVFLFRLWENSAIVLIATRWHEDGLIGRILQSEADKWKILRLPALAETQEERDANDARLGLPTGQPDPLGREPGEALCPRRYSKRTLEELRASVGPLAWSALGQGVPRAAEGNMIKRAWLPIIEVAPVKALRGRYWDFASSRKGTARSAGVRMAIADGIIYIEDSLKGHWTSHERQQIMLQTAKLDGVPVRIWFEQEPGSSGKEVADNTKRMLIGFAIQADPVTGSKDVRLQPFADQAQAGNVRLLRGPWNGAFIEELCSVPVGTYRDQADATAGIFNKLAPEHGLTYLQYLKQKYAEEEGDGDTAAATRSEE